MVRVFERSESLAKKIIGPNSNPSFSSILAGIAHGDVWVNDFEKPTLALVYSNPVGGYRILGNFVNDTDYTAFIDFLERELFELLKANNTNEFEFDVDDLNVEKRLLDYFSKYKVITDQELTYIKYPDNAVFEPYHFSESAGYKFLEVDNECVSFDYINRDFMISRIIDSWGSIDSFFKYGKAFIAVDKNEIIGIILGSAYYDNLLAIDIETQVSFRKKGIATILTNCLINYCREVQITAYWNCTASNIGSQNIAKHTGFSYAGENNYYYFSIL